MNAIITGSTSGIGLEIAQKLASLGYNIIINGFGDKDKIEEIRTKIEKDHKISCIYHPADLTKYEEVADMFRIAKSKFNNIDILINNAGIQHVAAIDEFPIDKWELIVQLNLVATFYTIRLVLPMMKAKQWGRIINIASAHGLVASPFKSAYVAAKHGLVGLTKAVALEVAEQGITVNSLCPGYVLTPLVVNQIEDTANARHITKEEVIKNVMLGEQPTKKFVETSEIAALVAFLCSNNAASITGSNISIDGGWTAH